MSDNFLDDDTSTYALGRHEQDGSTGDRLQLIVHIDDTFSSFRLPNTGEVTIGRGITCDVRVVHPSVSRAHAVLEMGTPLRIRDVGSANGTRVGGMRLEPDMPVELAIGDAFVLGGSMAMIQRVAAAPAPRRVQSHDYFEARVEEECARRSRNGGGFAVVRVHVSGNTSAGRAQAALHGALRAHDVLALYAPNQYEILLDGVHAQAAEEVTDRLRDQLAESDIHVEIGIASYPGDGATAGALFAHANDAVRGGRPSEALRAGGGGGAEATAMEGLRELVARVAASNISVLILGETGVGKEVLAETVHRQSRRASGVFLRLNCAALSESLLESELFGHERGAFTGAVAQKRGLLETADGGTVFLDEVGELPPATQVKLLRVIEERTVTRVGGLSSRSLDVRFVAATNRDLESEVSRGTFRQDLFFRLNGITIVIPPLRDRAAEIEPLAKTFAAAAATAQGVDRTPQLTREARAYLMSYSWPGNIRELRNVMERAVLLAGDGDIAPRHLPLEKMKAPVTARFPARSFAPAPVSRPAASSVTLPPEAGTDAWPIVRDPPSSSTDLRGELEALERQRILDALERCVWNQTKAAQLLGLSRGVLMARLDQYGIARPRKR